MSLRNLCYGVRRFSHARDIERMERGGFAPLRRHLIFCENVRGYPKYSEETLRRKSMEKSVTELIRVECGNRELRKWLVEDCGQTDLKRRDSV